MPERDMNRRWKSSLCVLALCALLPATANCQSAEASVADRGIVSGEQEAASSNTLAFRKLVSPKADGGTESFTGKVLFEPNSTYYFNDIITFRDGIHLDLQGSTLHFAKTASSDDIVAGFIFALRDFSIENGSIEVDYDGKGLVHAGTAIQLGQRWASGVKYFPRVLDSQLPAPMGRILVRNIQITSDNTNDSCGILMLGGLVNVTIDKVTIDGQGKMVCGIYYEFGTATQPGNPAAIPKPRAFRTSHAHGMKFTGVTVRNLDAESKDSTGLGITGAYDTEVDGLVVDGASTAFYGAAGEAAFHDMWPAQVPLANRVITLRHITATRISGTALSLTGAGSFSSGYLGKYFPNSSPAEQTDLLNYVVSGFDLTGTGGGWGIYSSAASVDIHDGTIKDFQRGMVFTDDCTKIRIDNVKILDSAQQGIQLNFKSSIWQPPRPKSGSITNSFIAGSGAGSAGYPAISLNNTASFLVENNTFGYASEKSQGGAVLLDANSKNVTCRYNKVVSAANGARAFRNDGPVNGNVLQGNTGVVTSQGAWQQRN